MRGVSAIVFPLLASMAIVGCGSQTISPVATQTQLPSAPTVTAAATLPPPKTPAETGSPSATPLPSATTVPTQTPALSHIPEQLDLVINIVPRRFTKPLGRMRSLGDQIVWATERDLYRYVPNEGEPEIIYSAPRGSYVADFVGSSAGYAMITQVTPEGHISFQWRLWYVPEAGGQPVLLDEFDNEAMPLPTLAMDDRRIVWTRTRGTGDDVVSELRVVGIDDLEHPRTLASYPFHDTNVEYPALNGDELWYGIRDNDWDAGTESPRVEMLDLANPEAPPEVYGADSRAFMPAVNDDYVVWKGGGYPQDSADNWDSVFVYRRADGSIDRVPDAGGGLDRIGYPSLGDRFVAWWDGKKQLYVYDLKERAPRRVIEYDPNGGVIEASVSGNLLAFEEHAQLGWAVLPE